MWKSENLSFRIQDSHQKSLQVSDLWYWKIHPVTGDLSGSIRLKLPNNSSKEVQFLVSTKSLMQRFLILQNRRVWIYRGDVRIVIKNTSKTRKRTFCCKGFFKASQLVMISDEVSIMHVDSGRVSLRRLCFWRPFMTHDWSLEVTP